MNDPQILRTIYSEVRRSRDLMDAIAASADRVAVFAPNLEGLDILRRSEAVGALVGSSDVGAAISMAVNRAESAAVPIEEVVGEAGPRGWREWLRPSSSPDARAYETPVKGHAGAPKSFTPVSFSKDRVHLTSERRNQRKARAWSLQGDTLPTRISDALQPATTVRRQVLSTSAAAADAVREAVQSAVAPSGRGARLLERIALKGLAPAWKRPITSPIPMPDARADMAAAQAAHLVSSHLQSPVTRAERTTRGATPVGRSPEPTLPTRPGTDELAAPIVRALTAGEAGSLHDVPQSARMELRPQQFPSNAALLSGLRRLAALATDSIDDPQITPPQTAQPDAGHLRTHNGDFATRLAEALRAEAERHGIDTEGSIR